MLIVFRYWSPGLPEAKLQRLVEVYFKGQKASTMRSYESSFRKLGGLCIECDLIIFRLDEGARCLLWVEARDSRISVASMRGISAVISLLQEVMGEEEISSGREKTLKKALAKESNLEVVKRKREPGTWSDVKALVQEAECTGRRADCGLEDSGFGRSMFLWMQEDGRCGQGASL
jgi:hypothetical protein